MTTLLFVHSPVAGPSTWIYTAEVLQQNDFECVVPDLTATATTGPPYYPKYASAAAAAVDGGTDPVVLVGHSAAGALLPAIAEAVGDRTKGALFVDAMLPQPGRSWFDTAPQGLEAQLRGFAVDGVLPPYHEWFPPGELTEWVPDPDRRRRLIAEIPRMPLAYFDEPAPPARFADSVACAFVRLGAPFDAAADKAERLGWWVARRDWDHLRMLSDPQAVADVIGQAISATQPR
ncbi:alpha/beta hydrolase [Mycobacterium sp. OAE908]|uniref:alpha/beta fold hydrolase n=1 Tax=Mycobacterium sp. OAE908 TaxID=2817899 RepID=UPI001AE8361C